MKKLLLRKNFQRTFAFLLTLVIVTGIAGIGFTAEARTTVDLHAFTWSEELRRPIQPVSGVGIQISIINQTGTLFNRNATTNRNGGGGVSNLNTVPNGSTANVTITNIPSGYRIYALDISMNRIRHVLNYEGQNTFQFTTYGTPWLNSFSVAVLFVPIIPTIPIEVRLDGTAIEFDVFPQVTDGRTLVPLRAIFEALGAEVSWNAETQTVTGTKGNTTVVLPIGSTSPTVNGQVVNIDVPGTVVNGRTLVPLRFVAESFGVHVNWDAEARQVTITS